MTESAERPLIGPDENVPEGDASSINANLSAGPLSIRLETTSSDQTDDDDDDDDGPVIRRIPGLSTPRLFASQIGQRRQDDDLTDDFDAEDEGGFPPSASLSRATPFGGRPAATPYAGRAPAGVYGDPRRAPAYSAQRPEFSVAAIRDKRMCRPAGTHKPTSVATKLTVATLASICLISGGVSLGLYGQEIGRSIERNAMAASTAVAGVINRIAQAGAGSLSNGASTQASMLGVPVLGTEPETAARAPLNEHAANSAAATGSAPPVTGRKLIYKRLPTGPETASGPESDRKVQAMKAADASFDQLLAPPANFASTGSQID